MSYSKEIQRKQVELKDMGGPLTLLPKLSDPFEFGLPTQSSGFICGFAPTNL